MKTFAVFLSGAKPISNIISRMIISYPAAIPKEFFGFVNLPIKRFSLPLRFGNYGGAFAIINFITLMGGTVAFVHESYVTC